MVIVAGSESSGTRLVKQILMMNGYDGGKDHHEKWGNTIEDYHVPPAKNGEHRVWRHSLPMAKDWPDIHTAVDMSLDAGHKVLLLWTIRAIWPVLKSVKRKHQGTEEEVLKAWSKMGILCIHGLFWPIIYEELIKRGADAFRGAPLVLPIKKVPPLRDENAKWYRQ
jgi:hypothetical protein